MLNTNIFANAQTEVGKKKLELPFFNQIEALFSVRVLIYKAIKAYLAFIALRNLLIFLVTRVLFKRYKD